MSFRPNQWIGKKNIRGYLKFWYYQRRGWIFGQGMYYIREADRTKRKHWWSKI